MKSLRLSLSSRRRPPMTTAIVAAVALLLLLPPHRSATDPSSLARSLLDGAGAPPIVLPLLRTFPNSSRRELAGPSDARMKLYDDLLTNGYYTTRLHIGTPPQSFSLIVDSGSTVTYVPCSTCQKCGVHQDPRFRPDSSATYKPVKCDGDFVCNCDKGKNQCTYERQYAEMSTSSGVLGEDLVAFGSESALEPQRAVFGCENAESGDLYTQHADGIIGLGRGHLSIVDQLVNKKVINDSFSLCYGGMDVGGGAMVLGEIPTPPGMVFANSSPFRSPYYNIDLKDIQVSGESLNLDSRIFDRKFGTILDSGTTYAYLPEAAFTAVKNAIIENTQSLKQIPGSDPKYNDLCFSGAGSDPSQLLNDFPQVDMVFSHGQKIPLYPENYLFRHSKVHGAYCLGFFKNERDPSTLLGGIVVRNTLVTYDRKNKRIGFLKTNCSELWEKWQQVDTSPSPPPQSTQPPPGSYGGNLTGNESAMTPAAPSPPGLQDQFSKGQLRVEFVTFDMYLSLNLTDLEPHMSELTELIANALEVDFSQVHLLNSISIENGSLVRWAVYPEKPGFFSSVSAMAIISRLQEHQIHLPANFGNYQLRAWKIEQEQKSRTWWQRHALILFVGGLAIGVFCSSALLVWHLYRRNRQLTAYRPVDAPGPEQELQPL